jgi:hypothetical protein
MTTTDQEIEIRRFGVALLVLMSVFASVGAGLTMLFH